MRKIITVSLAAVATLAASGVAYAQAERGELTRAAVEQRTTEAFARMDANDDGVLDQADREARHKQAFDRLDADHDGAISLAEFSAGRADRGEARAERREQRAERRGPGRPGFALRGLRGPDAARDADTDRDGTVSQAEFTGAALVRFDRADADKDGTISRDERRALRGPRPGRDAG
ncbi:MAG TPA: EF-hand domain-containing protein [Croceibacterium sp.]|nr:EF-hand domain-containing protein [Croceibacterium sp.]